MAVKTSKGFTIIEVLMALAIFGIGILAVAKMQVSSTGYNTSSRVYTEAAAEGAEQIEELINMEYDDPDHLEIGEHYGPYEDGIYEKEYWVYSAVEPSAGEVKVKMIDVEVTQEKRPDWKFKATYYKAIEF